MSNIIICPSVIHNGHHFMRYRVFEPYYIAHPPHLPLPDADGNYVLMGHFEDTLNFNQLWLDLGKVFPAYIPIRHPARNYVSMQKRNRTGEFEDQWRSMINFVNTYPDTMFLHLDDKELRETQVVYIQQKIVGMPANYVDWSVDEKETGSKHGTHDLEITDEMLSAVPQEFIDFYHRSMER